MPSIRRLYTEGRHWNLVTYLVIIVCVAIGFAANNNQTSDRQRDIAVSARIEAAQREYANCLAQKDGRQALRDTIEFATQGGSIDFTLIQGFENLDPATQTFFRNFSQLIADSDRAQAFRDFELAHLPLPDCKPPD